MCINGDIKLNNRWKTALSNTSRFVYYSYILITWHNVINLIIFRYRRKCKEVDDIVKIQSFEQYNHHR